MGVVDGSADVVDERVRLERELARRAAIRDITVQRYLEAEGDGGTVPPPSAPVSIPTAPQPFKMSLKRKK